MDAGSALFSIFAQGLPGNLNPDSQFGMIVYVPIVMVLGIIGIVLFLLALTATGFCIVCIAFGMRYAWRCIIRFRNWCTKTGDGYTTGISACSKSKALS